MTLRHEGREECGIRIRRRLREAVEYVFADRERRGFAKHGVFFEATFEELRLAPREADHRMRLAKESAPGCLA